MTSQWFYRHNGDPKGPVSIDQMRALADADIIAPETHVREAPNGAWAPAQATALARFSLFDTPAPASAPPVAGSAAAPPSTVPGKAAHYIPRGDYWRETADLAGVSRALLGLLGWAYGVLAIIFVFRWFKGDRELEQVIRFSISDGVVAIEALVSIGFAIAFFMWVHRSHANLFHTRVPGLDFTPGWAVGWYFIPVAFFWMPHQAMSELWRASHHGQDWRRHRPDPVVLGWWLAFWGSEIAAWISMSIAEDARTMGDMKAAAVFMIIWLVASAASCYALGDIVRDITAAQRARRSAAV